MSAAHAQAHAGALADDRSPRPQRAVIAGLGLALPGEALDRSEAAALLSALCPPPEGRARAWAALLRRSGVETRHAVVHQLGGAHPSRLDTATRMALFAEHAPALGDRAARAALQDAGTAPDEVTHLITVSCTGLSAPGLGVTLCHQLGLDARTQRLDVSFMGCHGVMVALRQADALVRADADARVLVCAVELCSLHVQPAFHQEQAVAQALFADGAGACLVMTDGGGGGTGGGGTADDGNGNGSAASGPHAHGSEPTAPRLDPPPRRRTPLRLLGTGTLLLDQGRDLLGWDVGQTGFQIVLSPRLPDVVGAALGDWLRAWLDEHGLGLGDVQGWCVHPGGPRILAEVQRALDLPTEALAASRDVLARCGNMSSPSVLFVLERLAAQGGGHPPRLADARRPTVMLGLGPGPSFEACLLG